jgi:hypothetical protein
MGFLGRPPLLPFSRLLAALRALVIFPSATAAGFFLAGTSANLLEPIHDECAQVGTVVASVERLSDERGAAVAGDAAFRSNRARFHVANIDSAAIRAGVRVVSLGGHGLATHCFKDQRAARLAATDAKGRCHPASELFDVCVRMVAVQPSENHVARCVIHEQDNNLSLGCCQVGKTLGNMRNVARTGQTPDGGNQPARGLRGDPGADRAQTDGTRDQSSSSS